jgi:hypothetical protein
MWRETRQSFAATQQMGGFVSFAPLRAVQTLNRIKCDNYGS